MGTTFCHVAFDFGLSFNTWLFQVCQFLPVELEQYGGGQLPAS